PRVRNVVHDDAIWRQTKAFAEAKTESPKTLPANPTPPVTNVYPLYPHTIPSPKHTSGLPSKLPTGLTTDIDNPILGDWLISYRVPEIIKARKPMEKYSVPCTTSSEVGWIWGNSRSKSKNEKVRHHTLERFPREAHGKVDILRWWGGGRESLP
ncbi:hypothetical protein BC829DRAFT_380293, partial [Chytridium lagenaria]